MSEELNCENLKRRVRELEEELTKCKQPERLLRQSETLTKNTIQQFRNVFESQHGFIIFSLDKQYCYTIFTITHRQTMKHIWNVDIEIGMNMLSAIIRPDDREKAKVNFDRTLSGENFTIEEEYGEDKNRTWWENRYSPILGEGGEISGLTVFVFDITKRKQAEIALRKSESLYRLLADNVHDVIWTMDMEMQFAYCSPSVTRLRGYSVEEVLSQSLEEMVTSASLEIITKTITEALESYDQEQNIQTLHRKLEVESTCKDGSTVWVEITANIINDTDGQPQSFIGITSDISERKKAEKALLASQKQLKCWNNELEEKIKERTSSLEDVNTALRVLLKKREEDKNQIGENIYANYKSLILPFLNQLRNSYSKNTQKDILDILESSIKEMITPFSKKLSDPIISLTPTEIQVASIPSLKF